MESSNGRFKVFYLCFQVTREGQPSYAHVHEIIEGLRSKGLDVVLFEPRTVRPNARWGNLRKALSFLAVQVRLYRRLREARALYIRSHFASLPSVLLARGMGVPIVQEVNGPYDDLFIAYPWTCSFAAIFKWLCRISLALADVVIVVTPQLKEWVIREVGHGRIHIIPNGANIDLFHPSASLDTPLPKPYVLFYGTLARWHRIDILLQALSYPDWPLGVSLVVAGDGVERQKLEAVAAVDPRLKYLGSVPYRVIPGLAANSLAGLNTSAARSGSGVYPLKLFETLACGVPVITTDFPGQADLVREHGCGLVVPPEDPRALAEAVGQIARAPELGHEMGSKGRNAILREHTWTHRAEKTYQLLNKVVK